MASSMSLPPRTSLLSLPNEVILDIFQNLSPDYLHPVLLASKRLNRHSIASKLASDALTVDWKKLCISRLLEDRRLNKLLDSIIASQTGRLQKFQYIANNFGYDAKDTLLHNIHTDDDAEDVLARRFYSKAVLGHIHRKMAIEVWSKVKMGEKCNLEQALAAFDMFLLHDRRGDFNDISKDLDELSNRYKEENVGSEEETPRNQALSLARFVRSHNLTGVEDESNYRDLQNNFIGLALRHEDHPSLPLISTAIYCCLAQRLDIDARPCGFFPFHVHTIVRPPSGVNLDGQALADDSDADSMYLDPFATAEEVPSSNLLAQLTELGVGDNMRALYLGASPVGDVVLRSSRNILHSIQDSLGNGLPLAIARPGASASTKTMDIESALCSSLWASLLFGRQASDNRFAITGPEEMNHLQGVIRNLETCFPEDLTLVEENLAPQFRGLPAYDQLMSSIHAIRLSDTVPKTRRPRGSELVRQTVRFKVGQVFRHNRHDYLAIITGWDVCSEKNGRWAPTRNLDRLPDGGKEQSFYHAVVEDTTVRYVAQSSIEIVDIQEPSRIMMELAGKYFKRWDRDSRSFVSNMKDEYPED